MIRRPPRSTPKPSSAASDVYKRQKYRDAMSYSKIRSLKLRTLSWSENDIADLYRYLNLFRERYRYDVKVVKTLFTFMH